MNFFNILFLVDLFFFDLEFEEEEIEVVVVFLLDEDGFVLEMFVIELFIFDIVCVEVDGNMLVVGWVELGVMVNLFVNGEIIVLEILNENGEWVILVDCFLD